MLEEASRLSRLHVLPVLIGDNERTIGLDFDRSRPTPLAIPTDHYFHINPPNPVVNEEIAFVYVNDFIEFDTSVSFSVFSPEIGEPNGHFFLDVSNRYSHSMTAFMSSALPVYLFFCVWKDGSIIHRFDFEIKDKK